MTSTVPTDFEALCRCVCQHLDLGDPPISALPGTPPAFGIHIGDVPIGFMQAAADDPEHGVLTIDYGEAIGEQLESMLMLLLQANFDLAGPGAPSFGINPVNNHVLWQLHFTVAETNVTALCEALLQAVPAVQAWRTARFPLAPADAAQRAWT